MYKKEQKLASDGAMLKSQQLPRQEQPDLQIKFKDSQGYTKKPLLKSNNKRRWNVTYEIFFFTAIQE